MAILAVAIRDLADLKERINNITVAFDKSGKPVTTGDLEVGNAMTAFMRNTINPTLMCTAEYNPCLVHAGPFANIAVGQSSIIADRVGLKLFDYHVTESGFAADIGFEKFWNVKCRFSGLKPHVSVLTSTIRALKMHGGGPKVVAGKAMDEAYTKENLELVEKGCENMVHMIGVIRKAGINPVVCINRFYTDTDAECAIVRKAAEAAGARCAESKHWEKGGEGALEFADAVIDACNETKRFQIPLSAGDEAARPRRNHRQGSLRRRRRGLDSEAKPRPRCWKTIPSTRTFATMMVKTHLSLSHDPVRQGRAQGLDGCPSATC
jgi:formate--tetrahydrofolate ligase